ncbi:MAG: hypothetical protein H8E55_51640 [Pelagibacterales bacterium]|nr:hypothetical protein [Pelagibacterales bacterium]
MAVVINFSNNVEKFPKEKYIKGKKGVYQNLTVVINNEVDQFGFNAKVFVSQTTEERKAKTPKIYVGNGKVVWTDGKVNTAKQEVVQASEDDLTDLPF